MNALNVERQCRVLGLPGAQVGVPEEPEILALGIVATIYIPGIGGQRAVHEDGRVGMLDWGGRKPQWSFRTNDELLSNWLRGKRAEIVARIESLKKIIDQEGEDE